MANKTLPTQENQQDSESDDEEVIETSPCGRWEKHRKEVSKRLTSQRWMSLISVFDLGLGLLLGSLGWVRPKANIVSTLMIGIRLTRPTLG